MAEKHGVRLPVTGIVGMVVMTLGLFAIGSGGNAVILLIGFALFAVGLAQKSGRQRQRRHEELMAELRRREGTEA